MGNVSITFLGATETVTGSRFLISTDNHRILVDAGLYQGSKATEAKNWEPFPVDPRTIDAVVLTHAHLDHSGYLPLLTKQGFKGRIHATYFTEKLAAVVLHDSAFLQGEDARAAKKRGNSIHKDPKALYDDDDEKQVISQFSTAEYRLRILIAPEIFVTFYPSGHILGSAFIVVEADGKKFLFTSDMGRPTHPILVSPDLPPSDHFDVVLTESTYGDRVHEIATNLFADEINAALSRGGSILIPAFAVDRTEVILIALKQLIDAGSIRPVSIYVDSPMALTSLNYYREALRISAIEIREDFISAYRNQDPFDPGSLYEMQTVEESKSLNDLERPGIIISASGMASGGRVVHHLANMLPEEKNTVMLVGFQATGSRGRALAQGAKEIRIHGNYVPVRAKIVQVEIFSVHADSNELVQWLKNISTPTKVFVVHGEPDASATFANRLTDELGWNASTAFPGQTYLLP